MFSVIEKWSEHHNFRLKSACMCWILPYYLHVRAKHLIIVIIRGNVFHSLFIKFLQDRFYSSLNGVEYGMHFCPSLLFCLNKKWLGTFFFIFSIIWGCSYSGSPQWFVIHNIDLAWYLPNNNNCNKLAYLCIYKWSKLKTCVIYSMLYIEHSNSHKVQICIMNTAAY